MSKKIADDVEVRPVAMASLSWKRLDEVGEALTQIEKRKITAQEVLRRIVARNEKE